MILRRSFLILALCLGQGLPATAQPVLRIGLSAPLTGADAAFGQGIRQGAEQAVADLNRTGPRRLALSVADDGGEPRQAAQVAARLVDIAKILNVDIDFFFDGIRSGKADPGFAETSPPSYVADMMSTPEGLQLVRTFASIKSPKVRKSIVQLVNALAAQEETERSS